MKNSKSKFKTISLFLLLSFLLKPLWLFDKVDISVGDDLSYWIHASTLAFDFDFDYIDDHSIQNSIFNKETNAPEHPPGAGYMSSVFVFVFSLLDRLFSVDLNVTEMQIGTFSYAGYFASTLFFTYFGFKLINKISVIKNYKRYKRIVLLMSFLSTLVHYSTTRFLMAHAHEFFLVCFIIYNFEKNDEIKKKRKFIFFLLDIFCCQ